MSKVDPKIVKFEQYLIGKILVMWQIDSGLVKQVFTQLADDSWQSDMKAVYSAMRQSLIENNLDLANITRFLTDKQKDKLGGVNGLKTLIQTVAIEADNLELSTLTKIVDGYSRLRKLLNKIEDSEINITASLSQIFQAEEPEIFVDNYFADLFEALQSISNNENLTRGLKSLDYYIDRALENSDQQSKGEASDVLWVGWPNLYERFSVPSISNLGIIQGQTSHGKSTLMANWLLGAAFNLKYQNVKGHVVLHSLEDQGDTIVAMLGSILSQINSKALRQNKLDVSQRKSYEQILDVTLRDLAPHFLIDDSPDTTVSDIRTYGMMVDKNFYGPRVLGITDYLQAVLPSENDARNMSHELQTSNVVRDLHILAQQGKSAEILVTQNSDNVNYGPNFNGIVGMKAKYSNAVKQYGRWYAELVNYPILIKRGEVQPENAVGNPSKVYLVFHKINKDEIGSMPLDYYPELGVFCEGGIDYQKTSTPFLFQSS